MGGQPSINQDTIDQAILDLKITRDKLKKFQKQQERCQDMDLQKARELVRKGNKDRAKIVLKQKKAREIYINNAENMIQGIESQINNIQTKQIEINFIDNIKLANGILKKMNDLMTIDEVERIMDENNEQNDRLNEIQDLLTHDQNLQLIDDSDINRMLDELDTCEIVSGETTEKFEQVKIKPHKIAMLE